jgi:hypothetical protein
MRTKELQMKVSYEPNRLADVYAASAYKNIIPVIKHSPNSVQEKTEISVPRMFQVGGC